jgi:HK97 gp10 family phage protein
MRGHVEGLTKTQRKMLTLANRVERKLNRSAVTQTSSIVLKAARKNTPVRAKVAGIDVTGTLKKSMGRKIKVYKKTGFAVIGARDGFRRQIGTTGGSKGKGKPIIMDPMNILHLVELGHGGPAPAKATRFMQRSFDATKGAVIAKAKQVYAQGVANEAKSV